MRQGSQHAGLACGLGLGMALALAGAGCSSTGELTPAPADPAPTAPSVAVPLPARSAAPTGTGTYESNLADYAIAVGDVMALYHPPAAAGAGFASELTIELVERPGRCSDYGDGLLRANSKKIELTVQHVGTTLDDAAIKPGIYTIGKGATGAAGFERRTLTATCASDATAIPFDAAGGCFDQIEVKSFDGTHVTGTYELRATDGRYVTGAFEADVCNVRPAQTPAICK